jgi:hypothetical protein
MNIKFITGYLSENQRNTGSLEIFYDFSGISGFFVPNRFYQNEVQFSKIGGGFQVNKEYYPGIFISCYQETGFTGSGIFEGINTLKVFNNLSGDNISLFYNFGRLNCNKDFSINSKNIITPTGKIQILSYIESKDQSNPFEIILGLNDAYKLTLEFSGKINGNQEEKYRSTNYAELAFENAGAIRINNKNLEFSYFDIIENEISNNIINLTGSYFSQEKNIYIGNMPTGKYRDGYTGFLGVVDDFIGFNEYFDLNISAGISKLFIKTGEETIVTDITGVSYNVIQSGFLNPTGILGTGITGYQIVPSEEVINASCGESCVVYVKSGVTGIITGEKIEYVVVGQESYAVTQQETKNNLYDQDYASKFTKNYIVFTPALDSQDIFNINFYKDVNAIVDYPNYSYLDKTYIADNDLGEKNVLIFFNGVNIASNEYQISASEDRFKISKYDRDQNDLILYTLSSQRNFKDQVSIGNNSIFLTGINLDKYNLFLNGQKLINNYNYSGENVYVLNTELSGSQELNTTGYFGNSTAMSADGNIAIIGEYRFNHNNAQTPTGAAWVAKYDGEKWSKFKRLSGIYRTVGSNYFGLSSSTNYNGTIAAISDPYVNGGTAYIFTGINGNLFLNTGLSGNNSSLLYGNFLKLNYSGDILFVNDPFQPVGINRGAVWIYTGNNGSNWALTQRIDGPIAGGLNYFGNSIDIDLTNKTGIIGARASNDNSGVAYIITGNNYKWDIAASLTGLISGFSYFGSSVAINKEGNIAAVGAPWSNNLSGIVYLYTGNNNNWNIIKTFSGTYNSQRFGSRIKMSKEENILGVLDEYPFSYRLRLYSGNKNNWEFYKEIFKFSVLDNFDFSEDVNSIVFGSPASDALSGTAYFYNEKQQVTFLNPNIDGNDQIYIKEDDYVNSLTGTNIKTYNANLNYNNEKIWLNGIYQNKNENYILTSCINEMMRPTGDIESKNETIFNNEYYRFN